MALEIYQIFILLIIGALVGIGMCFIGQTGQGLVMPIVLMLTGDVFLTIAINLLNDLITAFAVSVGYIRKREYKFQKNIFILILIALVFTFIGVFILMLTPIGNIYGWFIPLFIIFLGLIFIKSGYTTTERLKKMVRNIYKRFLKVEIEEQIDILSQKNKTNAKTIEIEEVIPSGSRLYFIVAIVFGLLLGINSGLFGANSGLIIVLALIILYGYPIKKSIGTALILSIIVSLITFTLYQILGVSFRGTFYINFEISLFLAIGSAITGILTSTYIQSLSAKKMGRAMGIVMASLGCIAFVFYLISQ
ncbi:MAG: sulfite exporter TauE/SafE family protein [Candidatus Heimdallarchaeota archaeon]